MLSIIKQELTNIINNIDSGNSNLTEDLLILMIYLLRSFNSEELSADLAAAELGVCRKTFTNYVNLGLIPEGRKEPGKTKYWLKSDLEKWKLETIKKT